MTPESPQACMAAFIAALLGRDIAAASALLTDDVVFYYSNGIMILGKDAFAATMTANWKRIERYAYTTYDPLWLAQSDAAAAVIYGFSWSGLADGKEVGSNGRATRVFRRETAGWRLAHEHLSTGPWKA